MKLRLLLSLGVYAFFALASASVGRAQQMPVSTGPVATPPIQTGGEPAANAAADVWLALLDDGQYERTWDTAAKILQNLVTKENWTKLLSAKRPPLGKLVSRQRREVTATRTLQGAPEGQYVVIQCDTQFEHKAAARETITVALDAAGGGQWRVSGYYVR